MLKLLLPNESVTQEVGELIGQHLQNGEVIILTGDLGTGKTTFSKGIARGLGIEQMIKSPTYTIVREYDEGRYPLYHMDVYRLDGDVESIGLDDYLDNQGVVLIEWGELIEDDCLQNPLHITLERISDEERQMSIDFGQYQSLEKVLTTLLAKYVK